MLSSKLQRGPLCHQVLAHGHMARAPVRPVLVPSPRTVGWSGRSAVSTSYSAPAAEKVAVGVAVEQLQEQEALMPLPREVEGLVDDPHVHNPLQRMERLGTGWFGVIMEHDGVLFQDATQMHHEAWLRVAAELGHPRPLGHLWRRVKGLRDDVVVTAVFNWTQNASVAKEIAERKVQIFEQLAEGRPQPVMLEAAPFLQTIRKYNIPVGVAAGSLSGACLRDHLSRSGLDVLVNNTVTGDDGGATEVEWYFMDAAQQIQRPPMRCILIGSSSTSIEVARELGMKVVIVAGTQPVYNFASADLVVKDLSQLTFSNLKKLFGEEGLVEPRLGDASSSGPSDMNAWDDQNDYNDFDDTDDGLDGGLSAGFNDTFRSSSMDSFSLSSSSEVDDSAFGSLAFTHR
mmetsp:Transcript_33278/g.99115  ORF Transcript_33278/g.99115 Transcript_33278/m.99115 type:complete len:400 (-) Transcript_33278:459-1658(-)